MTNFIYRTEVQVSGRKAMSSIFYFLNTIPDDGDYVGASVRACDTSQFGNSEGVPNGYRPVSERPGLFVRA